MYDSASKLESITLRSYQDARMALEIIIDEKAIPSHIKPSAMKNLWLFVDKIVVITWTKNPRSTPPHIPEDVNDWQPFMRAQRVVDAIHRGLVVPSMGHNDQLSRCADEMEELVTDVGWLVQSPPDRILDLWEAFDRVYIPYGAFFQTPRFKRLSPMFIMCGSVNGAFVGSPPDSNTLMFGGRVIARFQDPYIRQYGRKSGNYMKRFASEDTGVGWVPGPWWKLLEVLLDSSDWYEPFVERLGMDGGHSVTDNILAQIKWPFDNPCCEKDCGLNQQMKQSWTARWPWVGSAEKREWDELIADSNRGSGS